MRICAKTAAGACPRRTEGAQSHLANAKYEQKEAGAACGSREAAVLRIGSLKKLPFLVPMRPGDTPVLIPNTTVKTRAADGTMLETAWESRRAPDFWGYSSAGRAPALQAGGQGFESPYLHKLNPEILKKRISGFLRIFT